MRPEDVATVKRISDIVHADLTESDAVFAERLRQFPDGCLMTEDGYAVAHPTRLGVPPRLNELGFACPPDADALHVHDVTLLPHRQGAGLGTAALLLLLAVAKARGLRHSTLVAVAGKVSYWGRHGYRPAPAADPLAIAGYGAGATFMHRGLGE